MFTPVGSQPPSVYWRRRIIFLGALVLLLVLVVLTVRAITGGSGGSTAGGTPTSSPAAHSSASTPQSSAPSTSSAARSTSSSTAKPPSTSGSVAAAACQPADLAVQAVVAQPSYAVGQSPVVELQVTNTGAAPCVQDLADKQVELRVYNGESRVWGSHDCEVQSGTNNRTLAVNQPVRVALTWTGLTSQPNCAGQRQRVGVGSYTLYAYLSGQAGKAAQFSIT